MSTSGIDARKLDVGRVFGDAFGVIRRQAAPLIGLTLVLGFLPSVLKTYLTWPMMKASLQSGATGQLTLFTQPLYWVGTLISLVLTCLLIAAQLQIVISDLEGQPTLLAPTIRRAVAKILPVFVVTLLLGFGIGIGAILLLVPGIVLALMWAVALPSVVAESSNPIAALGRSRALTRGNRWRILGLGAIGVVVVFAFDLIALGGMGGLAGMSAMTTAGPNMVATVLLGLAGYAMNMVFSALTAALYAQLREIKGEGGERVAQVFA